jgi:hypothetical protein
LKKTTPLRTLIVSTETDHAFDVGNLVVAQELDSASPVKAPKAQAADRARAIKVRVLTQIVAP